MAKLKLRVIFQGGGARLSTLLAAAHAIKRRCADAGIEIQHVAGVSAGSIAAAAVASGLDIDVFRRRLIEVGPRVVAEFQQRVREMASLTTGETGQKVRSLIVNGFKAGDIWALRKHQAELAAGGAHLFRLYEGGSIVDFAQLEKALADVLKTSDGEVDFRSLKVPLTVFTSDLRTGSPRRYSSADIPQIGPYVPLSTVLATSAAMPFVFRGYKNRGWEVDGGICGNLPFLSADGDVKTLAISFDEDDARNVVGGMEFAQALLSSAIESGVRESRTLVNESGGQVCALKNYVGTYQFQDALTRELTRERFNEVADEIHGQLQDNLNQLFGSHGYKLARRTRFGESDVPSLFDTLNSNYPCVKVKSVKAIIHGEARRKMPADPTKLDERYYVDTLMPLGDHALTCQVGLPDQLELLTNMSVRVTDKNDDQLAFSAYWHAFAHGERTRSRILVFLDKLLSRDLSPIHVSVRFEAVGRPSEVFSDLRKRGWSYQRTTVSLQDMVEEQVWLGVLPEELKVDVQDMLLSDAKFHPTLVEEIGEDALSGEQWVAGEALMPNDVERILRASYSGELVDRTQLFGWRVGRMTRGQRSGFVYLNALPSELLIDSGNAR